MTLAVAAQPKVVAPVTLRDRASRLLRSA